MRDIGASKPFTAAVYCTNKIDLQPSMDTMQKSDIILTESTKTEGKPVKWSRTLYIVLGVVLAGLVAMTVMVVLTYIQVKKFGNYGNEIEDDELTLRLSELSLERLIDKEEDDEDPLSKDVDVNIRYHLPQSGTIEERVVVTADEEDISTPEVRVIYDYKHGHVVTHFRPALNESEKDVCFVRKFTPTTEGTELIKNEVLSEQEDEYVSQEVTEELFETTGEIFDKTGLSERSATMCQNSEVYVVTKSGGTSSATSSSIEDGSLVRRRKRQAAECEGFKFCGSFCLTFQKDRVVRTCTKKWWRRRRCKYVVRSFPETECFDDCYCLTIID